MKRGEFDILARAVQAASCSPCFSKGWTEQGPQKLSSQSWGHSTIITTSSSDKWTHQMAKLAVSPLLVPSFHLLSGGCSRLRLSWNTCPSGGGHHHHTVVLQCRWVSRPTSPKGFHQQHCSSLLHVLLVWVSIDVAVIITARWFRGMQYAWMYRPQACG